MDAGTGALGVRTFDDVRGEVEARAARRLPDVVVLLSALRLTAALHLVGPGLEGGVALGAWARRQFAALLGMRWEKWVTGVDPARVADEVSARLARLPGAVKVRARRDPTGAAAGGVATALLSPSCSPIDDARVFARLAAVLGRGMDAWRFARVEAGGLDATTHYLALAPDPIDVPGAGLVRRGWHLRNSEAGASALTLDDAFAFVADGRVVLHAPGAGVAAKARLLYRTHRAIEDDALAGVLAVALSKLAPRWDVARAALARASAAAVPHPRAAIAALLDDPTIPRALADGAGVTWVMDGCAATRLGVVRAVAEVGRVADDADEAFEVARRAGAYLLADGGPG